MNRGLVNVLNELTLTINQMQPVSTHDLHDCLNGNETMTLTLLKGLLYECEYRGLIQFRNDKTWEAKLPF